MVGRTQPAAVKMKSSRAPASCQSRLFCAKQCESRGQRSPEWLSFVDRITHLSNRLQCAVVRSTGIVGPLPLLDTVVVRELHSRTGCARPASRLRSSPPKLVFNAPSLRYYFHAACTDSPPPFSDVQIDCTRIGLHLHEPPSMHPDPAPSSYLPSPVCL